MWDFGERGLQWVRGWIGGAGPFRETAARGSGMDHIMDILRRRGGPMSLLGVSEIRCGGVRCTSHNQLNFETGMSRTRRDALRGRRGAPSRVPFTYLQHCFSAFSRSPRLYPALLIPPGVASESSSRKCSSKFSTKSFESHHPKFHFHRDPRHLRHHGAPTARTAIPPRRQARKHILRPPKNEHSRPILPPQHRSHLPE